MTDPVNRYGAPDVLWARWPTATRAAYVAIYEHVRERQNAILHKSTPRMPRGEWEYAARQFALEAAGLLQAHLAIEMEDGRSHG